MKIKLPASDPLENGVEAAFAVLPLILFVVVRFAEEVSVDFFLLGREFG